MDFESYMKSLVYKMPVPLVEDLIARIFIAARRKALPMAPRQVAGSYKAEVEDIVVKAAPAREDSLALAATTAILTVRCPQRYVCLFSFFIETRGESETYKKDGTDKDYTTNT
ncbi:hypothetical protein TNCV_4549171 [Trichonephila clavipes]|nr:hypothetical protein TNCV_4549171 [Trichonephila clavipes]